MEERRRSGEKAVMDFTGRAFVKDDGPTPAQDEEGPSSEGGSLGGGGGEGAEEVEAAAASSVMEDEVIQSGMVLPSSFTFKTVQSSEKYPKGQSSARRFKHLKQIVQAENYHDHPPDEPNYVNIDSPPPRYPGKKLCDVTGYPTPYTDPKTKLRFADTETFKKIRSLPEDHVQRYLALRNAAVVLK